MSNTDGIPEEIPVQIEDIGVEQWYMAVYSIPEKNTTVLKCPECKSTDVVINGRCFTCYSCGFSLCSM